MKARTVLATAIVFALIAMAASCGARAQVLGGYVHRGAAPSKTVIVFIHGLGSSARDAWTNPKTKLFWPDAVRADAAFNSPDIFLVDYLSSVRAGDGIANIADGVANFLRINSVWDYSDVVIVAHSLGGIVARRLILESPTEAPRVKLLYLIASPTAGSRLADYGARLGVAGKTVADLREIAEGNFLDVLKGAWETKASAIPVYCALEGKVTSFSVTAGESRSLRAWVVSAKSGSLLCNRKVHEHPQHDHSSISKPESSLDSVHAEFRDAFAAR